MRASARRGCGPRDSASRKNTHASAHRFAVLSSAARTFGAPPPSQSPKIGFERNAHASAYPAAETISDKGRSCRRSVRNRRPFDCFKSAEGIRFSVVARPTPKSFHRGGFWRNLLTPKGCIKKENAVRRTARAAAFAPRRPATRSTLVRVLRRLLPECLKYTLPFAQPQGNTNQRQTEGNHACMNCRGAKEENKRSAVKIRRGETISGSVLRLR